MNLGIVIRREYMERVGKKSFILTTILMPLLMVAVCVLPALMMEWAGPSQVAVTVIDRTGQIAGSLRDNNSVTFTPSALALDSAVARMGNNAVLLIPDNAISAPETELQLYTDGPSGMQIENLITTQVNSIIQQIRLNQRNLPDMEQILAETQGRATIKNLRTDLEGKEGADSSLSFGIGMGLAFLLYMFLMIYGQMIVTSIIEEKNNRVLELVVSSVKASDLMMGKILGITLVAVTQIVIWGAIVLGIVQFLLPVIFSSATMAQMLPTLGHFTSLGYMAGLIGQLTLFLLTGFLFYAAIFAAVGSAVDNIQDAQQINMFTIVPIILGIIFATNAVASPDSTLALVTGLIPFTSPMVMVSRLPFDIPGWQVWTSLGILALSFCGMVWVAGKIYRVGIFMYGKKPSIKEIARWVKYK